MLKRLNVSILAIAVGLCLTLAFASFVSGKPFRLKKIPDEGKNFGCLTCHLEPGGGNRNPFGKDYEKIAVRAGDKYTPELGQIDSDGDGFSNDQEFSANTNPGDPQSKPGGWVSADEEQIKAIDKGRTLFVNTKLGKSGMSCNSCHPGGATTGGEVMGVYIPSLKGAAATFPKYKAVAKRVITLSQMNNICIEMMLKGKPLKLDGDEAIALTAFVTSLSNGIPIQIGKKK